MYNVIFILALSAYLLPLEGFSLFSKSNLKSSIKSSLQMSLEMKVLHVPRVNNTLLYEDKVKELLSDEYDIIRWYICQYNSDSDEMAIEAVVRKLNYKKI